MTQDLSDLTVEDLAADPKKYGLPTLQEFMKDPERYRNQFDAEARLGTIDNGSVLLKNIKRHIYFVNGYKCKNLEEAQVTAKNMGYVLGESNPKPEIVRSTDGKFEIHVRFEFKNNELLTSS